MTNVTEKKPLTALDVMKWFKSQNRRIKGTLTGSIGLALIALAIMSSFMLPQPDRIRPSLSETEELIKTAGVFCLMGGLVLTHLAMYLFGSYKRSCHES